MEELYLPVLSHFENGNTWIASIARLRFQLTPKEGTLSAEAWEGPWSYEFSTVEATADFPQTEEGLAALRLWLTRQADQINARPPRTLAENQARRKP